MTNTASAKILVFDSGVGGLSILQALQQALPGCEYTYASDNQAFPYGTKNADFLIQRVHTVLQALIEKTRPDLIVVACNTASTLVLPHIRQHFSIPIVGVVPAIKPAALLSKTGIIGLLATPGTVARPYTKNLVQEFANDCEVVSVGSAELVTLAEQSLRGTPPPLETLSGILKPLFDKHQLDTIVLACTHFPLIKDQLIKAAPRPVNWVDSGEAIARRVSTLLTNSASIKPPQYSTLHTAIFTMASNDIDLLGDALNKFDLDRIDYIQL
ncbi:MAG: glutamate racemase [Gammaproteobacteria bacterium]|nr:glutamate racemase [Gammaproteobacteria bacterium]MBQ0838765.1 glutamate racemase [Gammaproteobacteria bacterium]